LRFRSLPPVRSWQRSKLPTDVAGRQMELKIEVTRKNTAVRARRNITISK
jgi:hypothetical protein